MALAVADGTITVTTGPVGTTFTVSGLAFQPKAVFLFWSGRATTGQGEADHKFGAGFFTATSARRAFTSQSDHGATVAASDCARYNDCCVATLTTGGAVDGKADIDAITSDGFRLIVDDQFSAALQVGWIAWGGTDLTDAAIIDFQEPASTGNQDYDVGIDLDTGEDDKAVIFLGYAWGAFGSPVSYSDFTLGVVAGNTPVQASMSGTSTDTEDPTQTNSYCRAGDCVVSAGEDSVYDRASLTAWLSNGFRLNWTAVSSFGPLFYFSALVLKGGRWFVGDALTSTGTSNQTASTPYIPKGLLLGSAGRAASSAGTADAGQELIIGCATSATSRRCAAVLDKDNVGTTDIGIAYREDAMYINQSTAGTIAVEGLMDLVSFDATPGFTFVMDDADPSAAFFFYLGCADAPSEASAQPPRSLHQFRMRR